MTTRDLVKATRRPEPEERRTHARVRRGSQKAGGRWETRFARKITWREGDQIRRAAQMMDERSKKAGDRRGCLGLEALKILKLMTEQLARTGRFDMAYGTIARLLRIARSCTVAAMARLRNAGFVFWVRRCVPTDLQGQRGPQYAQTSNLYRRACRRPGARCWTAWSEKRSSGRLRTTRRTRPRPPPRQPNGERRRGRMRIRQHNPQPRPTSHRRCAGY